MIIRRVKAKDFGCWPELDIELHPGVNAILGKNGSGKSTILDMIRMAITGETAAEGSKADNVAWGSEFATVTVEFDHGDSSYEVHRRIGKNPGQYLITPEGRLNRATEIQTYLEDILGTTMSALLNNTFVPQGRVDSILFSTNSQRLKEIQQTVGLQHAAEAAKALGNEASRYPVTVGLEQQIQMAEEALEEARDQREAQSKELAKVEFEMDGLQPKVRVLERLHQQQVVDNLRQRLERTRQRLADAELAVRSQEEQHQQSVETLGVLKEHADSARASLAEYEADLHAARSRSSLEQRLNEVEQTLSKLPDIPLPLDKVEERLESLQDKIAKRRAQLASDDSLPRLPEEEQLLEQRLDLEQQLEKIQSSAHFAELKLVDQLKVLRQQLKTFGEGHCPTCGQEVPDNFDPKSLQQQIQQLEDKKEADARRYREQNGELVAQLEAVNSQVKDFKAQARQAVEEKLQGLQDTQRELKEARQILTERQRLEDSHQSLTQQLGENDPPAWDAEEVERLKAALTSYEDMRESERESRSSLQIKRAGLEQAQADMDEVQAEWDTLPDENITVPTEDELAAAKEAETRLAECGILREKLLRDCSASNIAVQQYESSITALKEQVEKEAEDATWVAICKRAREALHVTGLPSLLMREYATVLNRHVQHCLRVWEQPFRLELDDQLAFRAYFDDGRELPAARLSGGQRVAAAISFRRAMANTFAKRAGLLMLDEPSNHLDSENIHHLQQLMLHLKEETGGSRQVIIVDHEESLVGFFDHTVTLSHEEVNHV